MGFNLMSRVVDGCPPKVVIAGAAVYRGSMRLFLYGTLLRPDVRARRGGAPDLRSRGRKATLPGWKRVTLRGTHWPLRSRCDGTAIGALAHAGAVAFARLAAYEGAANRLVPVVVATARGKTVNRARIAPDGTRRPWKG